MKGGTDPGGLNVLLVIHVQQKFLQSGCICRKNGPTT